MASSPITSWQIDGETVETLSDFIFLGSKITADGDCSHEVKRCLLLGRKAMTNLDSILKIRDIALLKSLLQHHSSKTSSLQHSAFFIVQLSYLYMTTGKTIALTRWTYPTKVCLDKGMFQTK